MVRETERKTQAVISGKPDNNLEILRIVFHLLHHFQFELQHNQISQSPVLVHAAVRRSRRLAAATTYALTARIVVRLRLIFDSCR
jgi:CRISPR/Cas system CMR-associated protein Cmr1 (group 7 of RAMP superfamily)